MEPISMIAAAVPGIIKGIGSLFGGGKRRREEKRAKGEYNQQMSAFKNFKFENAYEGMENPFDDVQNEMEDMRVATKSSEFAAEQQQQALAQTLESVRGSGGGTGAAAIAQALAGQQSRNQQQIAARIEEQEVSNERASRQNAQQIAMSRASAGQQINMAEAGGADAVQQREFDRKGTLLGMSQQRLAAAQQARADATAALGEGLGAAAGAFVGAGFAGKGPLKGLKG